MRNWKNKLHKDLVLFCYFMQILPLVENNSFNRWASYYFSSWIKKMFQVNAKCLETKHHNENGAML